MKKNIDTIINQVVQIATKEHKKSGFLISCTAGKSGVGKQFFPIRKTQHLVTAVVNIQHDMDMLEFIHTIDGRVDIILLDAEKKIGNLDIASLQVHIKKSVIGKIKLNDATVLSMDYLLSELVDHCNEKKVAILGAGNIGCKVALLLAERGAHVYLYRRNYAVCNTIAESLNFIKNKYSTGIVKSCIDGIDATRNADIIIGATPGIPIISREMIDCMAGDIVIDLGIGTILPEAITFANTKNINIFRLDMRPGFAGIITTLFETNNHLNSVFGKVQMDDFNIISGGFIGKKGDVVIDQINFPNYIVGIADGVGGILDDKTTILFSDRIEKVKKGFNL